MDGEVSYQPEEGHAELAARDIFLARLKRWRTWRQVSIICVAVGAVAALLDWADGFAAEHVAMTFAIGFAIGSAIPALTWTLCYFTLPTRARRAFREMRVRRGPSSWRWTATGFAITTPNGGAAYDWSEMLSVAEGRHTFILFLSDTLPLILPRAVLTPQQERSFRAAMGSGLAARG